MIFCDKVRRHQKKNEERWSSKRHQPIIFFPDDALCEKERERGERGERGAEGARGENDDMSAGVSTAAAAVCRNPAAGVSGRRAEGGGNGSGSGRRLLAQQKHIRGSRRSNKWPTGQLLSSDACAQASSSTTATNAGSTEHPRRRARSSAPASFFTGAGGGARLASARRHHHHLESGGGGVCRALAEDRPASFFDAASDDDGDDDKKVGEGVSSNVVSGSGGGTTPNDDADADTTTAPSSPEKKNDVNGGGSTTPYAPSPTPSPSPSPSPPTKDNVADENNARTTQLASSSPSSSPYDTMSQAQIDSVLPTGVDGQYIQGAALANAKDNVKPYWLAPLGVRRHLPLLIFLPGLDGSGLLIWSQLEELSPFYDVRCLAIPPADRSTYEQLAARINGEIEAERAARGDLRGMPVTVAGESFSGPLALMVGPGVI